METKLSKFQYTTPRIINFKYSANLNLEEKNYSLNIKHTKKISLISANEAEVVLNMKIAAQDESPIDIEFSVVAKFRWQDLSDENIKYMLNQTAPALLVGYARPIVSMFTNASGLSPFNLPMIDFTNDPIEDIS